jgi:cardiolipin synthase
VADTAQADATETIYRSEHRELPFNSFTHNNQIKLFHEGSSLYDRMIEAIDRAEEEVNLEVYIFREDNAGMQFVDAMIDAAKRGVTVRVILDAWGSFSFSKYFIHRLERAGVQLVRYRPFSPFTGGWGWRRRDHRKLLTIDGEIAFAGGMNIGREYMSREDGGFGIRDTHLEVQGPVVQQVNDVFSYNWENHHHALDDIHDEVTSEAGECVCDNGRSCARVTRGRWKDKNLIREDYLERIERAEDYIKLTQSYFLPTDDILEALYDAVERGCEVQLLVPGISDVPALQYGTHYLYRDLLDHGIEIHEYKDSLLHAKTAVIDDEWATVGTFNFDYQSIFHNLEVNITVLGEDFAHRMSEQFDRDLEKSRQVTEEDLLDWSWWDKARAKFWHWFRWAL